MSVNSHLRPVEVTIIRCSVSSRRAAKIKVCPPCTKSRKTSRAPSSETRNHPVSYTHLAPGTPIVDLTLETLQEDTTHLSDHLVPGCYTILHCWSGWCKPCLEEMPNLIKAYDIYHERGLNMIGIFLWDEGYNQDLLLEEYQLCLLYTSRCV